MLEETLDVELSKKKFTLSPMTLLELQEFEKISGDLKSGALLPRDGIYKTAELALKSIRRNDPGVTLEILLDAVTFRNYPKLLKALLEVSGLVMGEEKPGTAA